MSRVVPPFLKDQLTTDASEHVLEAQLVNIGKRAAEVDFCEYIAAYWAEDKGGGGFPQPTINQESKPCCPVYRRSIPHENVQTRCVPSAFLLRSFCVLQKRSTR
ncbi:hypothetical protein AJ80_06396 [Polytolypa hystricis UAMH7299]|uniref:Uncharacterized protein n=1 Tax=Polytolypa hystricis (strain UAMH7299) TaxID=1447883 RepID=A0A2B7XWF7_POLH7|nr:hypothetical protein AJ80_06396 [Polytolypa hystricis UAMH7299]